MKESGAAHFGMKIRNVRLSKGYKQEYIAHRIGIGQAGYSKIETGETALTLDRAFAIAKALDMSLVELIEWHQE
ncbi:XRE family transcriptional regulator [Dyadobacter luteus]|uniref:XRE family transcriptional regulator n=1 Tax=Dyadobacter luteus TaxID=2259619 RepID=A0A3D8Y9Q4_9BACT|nr:helix-turn-helix transcriptional regulator [Dyadobacter luteus]REA60325.1 XRE family transcriptional regulator [Dyadobacter luteus]